MVVDAVDVDAEEAEEAEEAAAVDAAGDAAGVAVASVGPAPDLRSAARLPSIPAPVALTTATFEGFTQPEPSSSKLATAWESR